jgi:hypothetical protein
MSDPQYHSYNLYIVLELLLELWFQSEVLCNVQEFDSGKGLGLTNMGRALALSMLLAHYMYLAAAALGIVVSVWPHGSHPAPSLHAMCALFSLWHCGACTVWRTGPRALCVAQILPCLDHDGDSQRLDRASLDKMHDTMHDTGQVIKTSKKKEKLSNEDKFKRRLRRMSVETKKEVTQLLRRWGGNSSSSA